MQVIPFDDDTSAIIGAVLGGLGLLAFAKAAQERRDLPRYGDPYCPAARYAEVLVPKGSSPERARRAWYYMPVVVSAARHFGAPEDLMMGLVHTESGWQPEAGSSAGAVGLGQQMPGTAENLHRQLVEQGQWPWGALDRTDPQQSAWMAAYHIAKLLKSRDVEHALAAYNAGSGRVKPSDPPSTWPEETQKYVPGVLRRASYYRTIWSGC